MLGSYEHTNISAPRRLKKNCPLFPDFQEHGTKHHYYQIKSIFLSFNVSYLKTTSENKKCPCV